MFDYAATKFINKVAMNKPETKLIKKKKQK